jgi:putative hemolysin
VVGCGVQLGLVGFLVLVNASFAGSELALVSLREGQLRCIEEASARGATLARLARDPYRFLATIQIRIRPVHTHPPAATNAAGHDG